MHIFTALARKTGFDLAKMVDVVEETCWILSVYFSITVHQQKL